MIAIPSTDRQRNFKQVSLESTYFFDSPIQALYTRPLDYPVDIIDWIILRQGPETQKLWKENTLTAAIWTPWKNVS